ncbi:peptidase [Streptomyces sp. SR27]|uniref:peptidase n=1 Tax=Streptomyces sp. SR27 TaxID=3076630 RepID=UPI00295B2B35|nr:peptidase [Streptomyces sp. SR27]MDV9187566.1 peptidase [Streptomyces sp. SR27]
MKIRRILATAVAAAVTTPVVFLSAAPAFAAGPAVPGHTQGTTQDDPDGDDFAEYEKLVAAVEKAEAKLKALKADRKAAVKDLEDDDIDPALKTELAAAKEAVKAAKAAKTAADETLAAAEQAVKDLPADATDEQKAAADAAVTTAKAGVEEAVAGTAAAELREKDAVTACDDARVALARKVSQLDKAIETAEKELADAEAALEEFEQGGPDECPEDDAVKVSMTGPKSVTAGTTALFSLRVSNTTDHTLKAVQAYAAALNITGPDGETDEEEGEFFDDLLTFEWSSASHPAWTKLSAETEDAIAIGELAKGGKADVKLRLTVDAETPAGKGVAFAVGAYEKNDGSCGSSEDYATVEFDILAAKGEKPTPKPSPSTTTPAPTGTGGNTNTTGQGGSSNTPVNGALAATGANDTLPLGFAAAAAVALGAGALVVARRRKAGAGA